MAAIFGICLALIQAAAAETVRVAAFGDSLVHGYGVNPEDGFVSQMNRWLAENGADAVVVNAGVSGDTTAGGLARINWTLESNPDALIVVLGGNDLLRGLFPEQTRSNLDGILARIAEAGLPALVIGQEAPGNFGPEYKAEFESIYPDLSAKYRTLLFTRFFAPLESEGGRERARERFLQDDGLHPNPAGVAVIVAAVGPSVLKLIQQARSPK